VKRQKRRRTPSRELRTECRVREVVRAYPITCFFAAVASGYLIGRVARRI
jgi:hypothetical protein